MFDSGYGIHPPPLPPSGSGHSERSEESPSPPACLAPYSTPFGVAGCVVPPTPHCAIACTGLPK